MENITAKAMAVLAKAAEERLYNEFLERVLATIEKAANDGNRAWVFVPDYNHPSLKPDIPESYVDRLTTCLKERGFRIENAMGLHGSIRVSW